MQPDQTGTPPEETPAGQEPEHPAVELPEEEPTLPPSTEEPPAEPEEPPLDTIEERILHRLQSWQGRRDAELREEMRRREEALLNRVTEVIPQATAAAPMEEPDPSVDPDRWFEHKLQQKVSEEQKYNQSLINSGQQIMSQDPLIKADPKLADEIYEEVQSGRVVINRQLSPQEAAAFAIAQAKSNVLTKRMMTKANPLENNKPVNTPIGGVKPPAAPASPVVKPPEMSDIAKQAASRWGFSDEELAEILK